MQSNRGTDSSFSHRVCVKPDRKWRGVGQSTTAAPSDRDVKRVVLYRLMGLLQIYGPSFPLLFFPHVLNGSHQPSEWINKKKEGWRMSRPFTNHRPTCYSSIARPHLYVCRKTLAIIRARKRKNSGYFLLLLLPIGAVVAETSPEFRISSATILVFFFFLKQIFFFHSSLLLYFLFHFSDYGKTSRYEEKDVSSCAAAVCITSTQEGGEKRWRRW